MKLRIADNSIRLRLSRSEVDLLISAGRVTGSVCIQPGPDGVFDYAIALCENERPVAAAISGHMLQVTVAPDVARAWASTEIVGIQGEQVTGEYSKLSILVEKDFACLTRSDEQNLDTFPHPLQDRPEC